MEQTDQDGRMSRREALKMEAAMIVTTAGDVQQKHAHSSYAAVRTLGEILHLKDISEEARQHRIFLKDRYGVDVTSGPATKEDTIIADGKPVQILGNGLSVSEDLEVLRTLRQELVKYPPDFIRGMHIGSFRVMKNLMWNQRESLGGFADTAGRRVFLSHKEHGVWNLFGFLNQDRAARNIHHELWHFISSYFRNSDSISRWSDKYPMGKNPYVGTWDFANDPYTPAFWQSVESELDLGGFVRGYGKVNEDEDQATVAKEVFLNLPAIRDRVIGVPPSDPVLHWKVTMLRGHLREVSKGAFDDRFWTDLSNGRVTEEYWMNRSAPRDTK